MYVEEGSPVSKKLKKIDKKYNIQPTWRLGESPLRVGCLGCTAVADSFYRDNNIADRLNKNWE
jgi:hypothetical protein